jgi:Protein of unknown function (DUF3352)
LPPVRNSRSRPAPLALVWHAIVATLALAAIAGVISGCGSSHTTGTTADPASVIPAAAPLYAGAIVRPEGALKSAALATGRTLTHQADPYLQLLRAIQTPGSSTLDFKSDVAPWLGRQAAVFLSSLDSSEESRVGQLLSALLSGSSTASAFPFGSQVGSSGTAGGSSAEGGGQGAIVLDTSDAAKARSFLDSQAKRAGAHPTAYRGVSYLLTPDGIAFGVVDHFAVIGSESAMRGVIDTTLGGPSLAQASDYASLLAAAPPGALAHLYANPGALLGPGAASQPSPALRATARGSKAEGVRGLLQVLAGTRPLNVSLVPSDTSIALDADTLASSSAASSGGLLSSLAEGAGALGELPGESWLAVGLGDVGATLGEDVQGLRGLVSLGSSLGGSTSESSASGSLSLKGLLEGILTPLGALGANTVEARHDFQSWMDSAGIFASGSGLLELKAGVVIASKNPALSRAAVAKLAEELRKAGGSVTPVSIPGTEASFSARLTGLPVVLDVAAGRAASGQSKFVLGLGEASVSYALNPPSTLSGSASTSAASTALGEGVQPSLTVNFTTLLSLLEGVGLTADPTISKFVPFLHTLTTLAGGGKSLGGGVQRYRLVLGLQQAG